MKKIILSIIGFLGITSVAFASSYTVPWTSTSTSNTTIFPYWNGAYQSIQVPFITATSTTATSTFAGGLTGPGSFTVQSGSGRVGIGTSNPTTPLHVIGNSNITGSVASFLNGSLQSANSLFYLQANSGVGLDFGTNGSSGQVRITTSGKVGIGTSSPGATLEVNSAVSAEERIRIGYDNFSPGYYSSLSNKGVAGLGFNIDSTAVSNNAAASILFRRSINSGSTYTNSMIIDQNGNVGIGTTNPVHALDVRLANGTNGIAAINGINSSVTSGTAYGSITTAIGAASSTVGGYFQGANASVNNTGGYFTAGTGNVATAGYFTATGATTNYGVYSAAGTNYFNGKVGIGTTSPFARLSLQSTSDSSPLFVISTSTNGTGTTTPFYIDANGKIGVGKVPSSSSFLMDINGTVNAVQFRGTLFLNSSADIGFNRIATGVAGVTNASGIAGAALTAGQIAVGTTSATALQGIFNVATTSGSSYLNVSNTGNVGVGTTTSHSALTVGSGDIFVGTTTGMVSGIILEASDASCHRITVSNLNVISAATVDCPF